MKQGEALGREANGHVATPTDQRSEPRDVGETGRRLTEEKRVEFSSTTEINWQSIKRIAKGPRRRSGLNGHALPVCETGKLRYRDRTQAQDALTVAKRRGATARGFGEETRRNECRAYVCPVCDGWHLTSQASRGVGLVVR